MWKLFTSIHYVTWLLFLFRYFLLVHVCNLLLFLNFTSTGDSQGIALLSVNSLLVEIDSILRLVIIIFSLVWYFVEILHIIGEHRLWQHGNLFHWLLRFVYHLRRFSTCQRALWHSLSWLYFSIKVGFDYILFFIFSDLRVYKLRDLRLTNLFMELFSPLFLVHQDLLTCITVHITFVTPEMIMQVAALSHNLEFSSVLNGVIENRIYLFLRFILSWVISFIVLLPSKDLMSTLLLILLNLYLFF